MADIKGLLLKARNELRFARAARAAQKILGVALTGTLYSLLFMTPAGIIHDRYENTTLLLKF